jgi:putative hydrolase of the HAD superfamily
MSLLNLKKKLSIYEIIIFDLDDTIYPQKDYDSPALLKISKFISRKIDRNQDLIFQKLRKIKKIRRGKAPNLLFNDFFKNIKITNKKKTIFNCVSMFQSYECKELRRSKSLKLLISNLYKKKILFIVTNGNISRQKKKIKYLGIKKYFKRIFILDGLKNTTKPSIKSVKYLSRFIENKKKLKAVYVGDNINSDKKFAENLKIDFIFYQFPSI